MKNAKNLIKRVIALLMTLEKCENELGRRFINIGREKLAVAVARVVELPPRCSNKGGPKRRCL